MLTEEALLVFAAHHGMATAPMLTVAGMSRRARELAVEDGLLEVLHERVFHIRSAPLTLEARCSALCFAYPRGFVTGPTGGRLTKLRRMPNDETIHFAVPHGSNIGPIDGVELRQTTKIEAHHVVKRGDGIRVASAARLAFDLARDLPPLDHRSVVEQLLKERRTTVHGLTKIARDLVHPARPGSARFIATLMSRQGPPAESHPEVLVADGLRRRGVPVIAQQRHLQLPNRKRIRLDLCVPEVRWAVEIDVHPEHLLLEGTTKDKQRDRLLHQLDWQVERVTELDLLDLEALCDELAELYRSRCANLRRAG
jgi:very-short-patch-repair endonuclease